MKEEENHLHKLLQSNGSDNTPTRAGSKELPSRDYIDTEQEKGLIRTIQYIAGLMRVFRECVETLTQHLSLVGH